MVPCASQPRHAAASPRSGSCSNRWRLRQHNRLTCGQGSSCGLWLSNRRGCVCAARRRHQWCGLKAIPRQGRVLTALTSAYHFLAIQNRRMYEKLHARRVALLADLGLCCEGATGSRLLCAISAPAIAQAASRTPSAAHVMLVRASCRQPTGRRRCALLRVSPADGRVAQAVAAVAAGSWHCACAAVCCAEICAGRTTDVCESSP